MFAQEIYGFLFQSLVDFRSKAKQLKSKEGFVPKTNITKK